MKELTPMELLDRLEWRRQLRNIMGRISHDYAVKQEAKVVVSGIYITAIKSVRGSGITPPPSKKKKKDRKADKQTAKK